MDLGIAGTVAKSGATEIACTINGKTAVQVEVAAIGTAQRITSPWYLIGTAEGRQIWIEDQETNGDENRDQRGPGPTNHHCPIHPATATCIENRRLLQETGQTDHLCLFLMLRHTPREWTGKDLQGRAGS